MRAKSSDRNSVTESIHGLAWAKRRAPSKESVQDEGSGLEEAVVLDALLTLQSRKESSARKVDCTRAVDRIQAGRDLHLFQLGYTGF